MIRTFTTRPTKEDDRHAGVLESFVSLMSTAEHRILAWLKAGKEWKAAAYATLYRELGLSAVMFRMARHSLDGKLASVAELAKLEVETLALKIKSKNKQIATKTGEITKARKAINDLGPKIARTLKEIATFEQRLRDAKTEAARQRVLTGLKKLLGKRHAQENEVRTKRASIRRLRRDIHQHKRRLKVLELRRERAISRAADPSLCFGSKKLFREQFHLKENGYADHVEWLKEWRSARRSGFLLVGAASVPSGNEVAKLSLREDCKFDLELRLPHALKGHANRRYTSGGYDVASIMFYGLDFNHGHQSIVDALATRRPISIRFTRDGRSWKISATVDEAQPEAQPEARFDDGIGCLGIDLNANHVAATLADRFGNPVGRWTIPLVTHGLSSEATRDAVRKAALQVARIAAEHDVPVASEMLDFAKKKAQIRADDGPSYARMLSSFAYASFDAALASACCRSGVWLRRVNPAFTSLIGRTCHAARYGMTVHAAAALAIARRAMGLSERMPSPVGGELKLPLDGGGHVTLRRPERIAGRHVWSSWRKLNDGWKSALAEHGRTRRKPRSPAVSAALPEGLGIASRRGKPPPSSVGTGSGVPG